MVVGGTAYGAWFDAFAGLVNTLAWIIIRAKGAVLVRAVAGVAVMPLDVDGAGAGACVDGEYVWRTRMAADDGVAGVAGVAGDGGGVGDFVGDGAKRTVLAELKTPLRRPRAGVLANPIVRRRSTMGPARVSSKMSRSVRRMTLTITLSSMILRLARVTGIKMKEVIRK